MPVARQRTRGRRLAAMALVVVVAACMAPPLAAQGAGPNTVLTPALRQVADQRPIRVGWTRDVQPLIAEVDGERVVGGWGYELWTLMAIRADLRVEHVVLDSIEQEVAALRDGTIDVVGARGPRPDLLAFADSTRPLAWERPVLLARPSLAVQLAADLDGRRVSAVSGSALERLLEDEFPRATIVPTGPTIVDAVVAIKDRKVDAYLTVLSLAGRYLRSSELQIASQPGDGLAPLEVSSWARAGSVYLKIARAARQTLTDGDISVVTNRWAGFDLGRPGSRSETPRQVVLAFLLTLAGLLVVGGFALVLRRRVRSATADLQAANDSLEERVMLRTADLHLMNASLSRFSRSIAHDLRNPITVISGMTNLLRNQELAPDAQARMLESIERSTLKLDEMISTMLTDVAQTGADVIQLDGAAYEGWLRGAMAAEVLASGADLQVTVPPGRLDLNISLILKVSLNLVGNALKYAVNPVGMRVEVTLARSGAGWMLRVDDNGPGLPAAGVEAVFSRGFRGHHDNRGQGWGLADVRELIDAAGGSVTAGVSHLGGAQFVVRLPHASGAADPRPVRADGGDITASST